MNWKKVYLQQCINTSSIPFYFIFFFFLLLILYFQLFSLVLILFNKNYLEKHNSFSLSHLLPFYISNLFFPLILISHQNIILIQNSYLSLLSFKVISILYSFHFVSPTSRSLPISSSKILHKSKTTKKQLQLIHFFCVIK